MDRLKWKPAEENSIDFKLKLNFSSSDTQEQNQFSIKPKFELYIWKGGDSYAYFDEMGMTDAEWET